MKCPVCQNVDLVMSDRQGVEIDYCPQCRGVWLDRGELDKIIERANRHEAEQVASRQSAPPPQQQQAPYPQQHPQQPYHGGEGYKPYKKRKSWWMEIFD